MPDKRTMSALPTAVPIVLEDSSAACSPRLGFPPVPANTPALLDLCAQLPSPHGLPQLKSMHIRHSNVDRWRHGVQASEYQHALPEGLPRRVGHGVGSPSPLVSSAPICILFSASELSRACASVFAAQNSTPCNYNWLDISEAFPTRVSRIARLSI